MLKSFESHAPQPRKLRVKEHFPSTHWSDALESYIHNVNVMWSLHQFTISICSLTVASCILRCWKWKSVFGLLQFISFWCIYSLFFYWSSAAESEMSKEEKIKETMFPFNYFLFEVTHISCLAKMTSCSCSRSQSVG